VIGSPANLITQSVDVKNYAFWKLHGWIDNVWDRYRKAKGLKDDDPAYQKLMLEQCNEMFALEPRNRNMPQSGTVNRGTGTTAPETGEFATNVRPFLDSTCAGCHSPIAPTAGMTLGGQGPSSAQIIAGLVGVKASNGEYNLIEPGAPHKSWVYLKASGEVASVTCTQACDRESMPPAGTGLTQAQLASLSQWIMNGATDK
jgi:mono/diheme cytochrome c family protein